MSKTQQLQARINKLALLEGYKIEWRNKSWWLSHPARHTIFIQSSRVAEKWLDYVEKTGRDNAALRRMK